MGRRLPLPASTPVSWRSLLNMDFVDPTGRYHKLDAKDAMRNGMKLQVLVDAAFRHAVGDLTEFPGGDEYKMLYDPKLEYSPVLKLRGEAREKMQGFFRFIARELAKEATG